MRVIYDFYSINLPESDSHGPAYVTDKAALVVPHIPSRSSNRLHATFPRKWSYLCNIIFCGGELLRGRASSTLVNIDGICVQMSGGQGANVFWKLIPSYPTHREPSLNYHNPNFSFFFFSPFLLARLA